MVANRISVHYPVEPAVVHHEVRIVILIQIRRQPEHALTDVASEHDPAARYDGLSDQHVDVPEKIREQQPPPQPTRRYTALRLVVIEDVVVPSRIIEFGSLRLHHGVIVRQRAVINAWPIHVESDN